jgi:DNA-binding transcriptional LysR family regulator
LAVIVPRQTALEFAQRGAFRIVEPDFGEADFNVALHWSHRHAGDPALQWMRALMLERFGQRDAPPRAAAAVEHGAATKRPKS